MLAQISESGVAVEDLGGTRQKAPLARRTPEVRQADRRLSNQPRSAQADQLARLASAFWTSLRNACTSASRLARLAAASRLGFREAEGSRLVLLRAAFAAIVVAPSWSSPRGADAPLPGRRL